MSSLKAITVFSSAERRNRWQTVVGLVAAHENAGRQNSRRSILYSQWKYYTLGKICGFVGSEGEAKARFFPLC